MKEKELRRLHRRDLLELLVEQSREASRLDAALKEKEEELTAALESNERLKAKLDEKDVLIGKMKCRLDEKDAEAAENAAESQKQLNSLKEKLDGKDALIEKLKSRLDEKDARLAEETAAREEQLRRLKGRLDEKDALIEKLQGQADRREEKIGKLETQNVRLRSDKWMEMKESDLSAELLARMKALL